ncbi:MAG: hypothetical protein FGM39_05460 [Phycisphaerales bacterium]|nr:hypothetical protein [Phycisphaerales bacterium]
MNIGAELLGKYGGTGESPRREPPPSTWERMTAHLMFLAGLASLAGLWLAVRASRVTPREAVITIVAFAAGVLAFRTYAWLRGPTADRMHEDREDGVVDLMMAPRRTMIGWRLGWPFWLGVTRMPICLRIGGREVSTTPIGTTPIQRAMTRLAAISLLSAWIMAR